MSLLSLWLQLWLAAGAVPDANDLSDFLLLAETVNHPVRRHDDFPNVWVALLGDLTSNLRKILEFVHLRHQPVSKVLGTLRTVGSNRAYEVVQVVTRGG